MFNVNSIYFNQVCDIHSGIISKSHVPLYGMYCLSESYTTSYALFHTVGHQLSYCQKLADDFLFTLIARLMYLLISIMPKQMVLSEPFWID